MTEPDDDLGTSPPRALRRDLLRLFGPQVSIPDSVDARLAALARRRRPRPVWLRAELLAAAALLVGLPLCWLSLRQVGAPTSVAREDFDRNGRIDVLDAYRLALALKQGQSVPSTLDLDGDGRVSVGDVDRIAAHAVRIRG